MSFYKILKLLINKRNFLIVANFKRQKLEPETGNRIFIKYKYCENKVFSMF